MQGSLQLCSGKLSLLYAIPVGSFRFAVLCLQGWQAGWQTLSAPELDRNSGLRHAMLF
jgi:hypothetical protein